MKVPHGQKVMLWLLFFLICMGLGYPTISRYDPRSVPGLSDSIGYSSLVTGGNLAGDEAHRILVPYLARPIYWLVNGHLHTWNPVFFALLAVNSFFIATTAYLLVGISHRIVGDYAVALVSGFLYLTNFAVPNFNLSGYVDSAVNCMMIAVAWAMLTERWWLLPICGVLGALAKETFVPLSAVFALAWWLTCCRRGRAQALSTGMGRGHGSGWLRDTNSRHGTRLTAVHAHDICCFTMGRERRRFFLLVGSRRMSHRPGNPLCVRMAPAVGGLAARALAKNMGCSIVLRGSCGACNGSLRQCRRQRRSAGLQCLRPLTEFVRLNSPHRDWRARHMMRLRADSRRHDDQDAMKALRMRGPKE